MFVDPLAEKTMTPYQYVTNNPIMFIDPTGMEQNDVNGNDGGPGDPRKGNVRFLIYTGGTSDGLDALKTREDEIKRSYPNDYIISQTIEDLGKLKDLVETNVKDAKTKGYDYTIEVSFFGHGGIDGPMGSKNTSRMSLYEFTGNIGDKKQLSREGWKEINWNFNPKGSLAAFYGCQTEGFAQSFFGLSNVKYTSGISGRAGGTYNSQGDWNSSWFGFGNVYMASATNGKVDETVYFKRSVKSSDKYGSWHKPFYTFGNLSINNKGILTNGTR